jgi:hypothetical protein
MADKVGAGIIQGSTSFSVPVELWVAATFLPRTSVAFASALAGYWRQGGVFVTITLVSVTAVNSAWTSGGWVRASNDPLGGNHYRLDVPDAALASGADWVYLVAGGPTNSTMLWSQFFPLIGASESTLWLLENQNKTSLASIATNAAAALTTVHGDAIAASLALAAYTGVSTALAAYGPLTTVHGDAIAASLALTAYAPLTTVHGDAIAASLALAAYTGVSTALLAYGTDTLANSRALAASLALIAFDPVTKTQANALAASLALAAYTGVSTALAAYGPLTTVHGDAIAASLALTAYAPLTTVHGDALAASLALTAYAPLTTTHGDALAASLALTAYGPLTTVHADALAASTALTAYGPSVPGDEMSLTLGAVILVADGILVTPANKLATDVSGFVSLATLPGIQKNVALANFEFLMVDSTDGKTAKTGLTVGATRSIDGAAFGACINNPTEIGVGIYKIDFDATDLNGDVITFRFTGSGALDRFITIKTTP